ncbi:MAG: SET domain-containing protein-lysine N-methyltransferase [Rhizobacter sp.]|nr:SET domain-containing protein-lysine N-methyltransferase [Ferruginibacter sp.]
MKFDKKNLFVKDSTLPNSGKGLFSKTFIPKGTYIIEYTGKVTSWKDVDHEEGLNGYIYYLNRNHVINASKHKAALARYANDARGLTKIKGLLNNAIYEHVDKKVFIRSTKNIDPGQEILVAYGKEYWDVIKENYKK